MESTLSLILKHQKLLVSSHGTLVPLTLSLSQQKLELPGTRGLQSSLNVEAEVLLLSEKKPFSSQCSLANLGLFEQ